MAHTFTSYPFQSFREIINIFKNKPHTVLGKQGRCYQKIHVRWVSSYWWEKINNGEISIPTQGWKGLWRYFLTILENTWRSVGATIPIHSIHDKAAHKADFFKSEKQAFYLYLTFSYIPSLLQNLWKELMWLAITDFPYVLPVSLAQCCLRKRNLLTKKIFNSLAHPSEMITT